MNGKGAGVDTYMVLDDLVGKPMSTISSIALLNQFSVKNVGVLKEKVVTLGMNEIGTVIRLLTSQGMVGRLGNLYDSLENLDSKYIEPSQDKDILLKPKSEATNICPVPLFLLTESLL
ncbi:hypothetical protein CQW23_31537 [Capsicum baccatum]|uniref:DUF674 domain-containing protein n=1 Tax=Capsicum baccatum TaxID=33114 RepID=A0A2G2V7D8_CAPBA|nr:hypothetical protein CQW23_31537 [Capsicum baccatum]